MSGLRELDRYTMVRVVSLTRSRDDLGGTLLHESHFTTRERGITGMIIGTNVLATGVFFVLSQRGDQPVIAAYGAEELEVRDDDALRGDLLDALRKYRV